MRFHFAIRDLFWLTLVVALAVGWWLDHQQASKNFEELQKELGNYNWIDAISTHQ